MDLHDLYPELVLEEVKNPQNRGKLDCFDYSASEGVASCGDTATVYIQIKSGKIQRMTWEAEGCAISRAGLSVLSVAVANLSWQRTVSDVGIARAAARAHSAKLEPSIMMYRDERHW